MLLDEGSELSAVNEKTEETNQRVFSGVSRLRMDISHTYDVGLVPIVEKLIYLLAGELFVLFVVFTHYPKLDERNKFITPMITGALTSFLGQTLTNLFRWVQLCSNYKLSIPNNTHSIPTLPLVWRNHMKFLVWGGISGILANFWIEFLVVTFSDKPYMSVLLDQTVGTFFFQALFTLFSGVWDVEFTNADPLSWRESLAICWKFIKLSYLLWPYVSVFCFTWAPVDLIFPINCIVATIFSVVLAMTSL